MPIDVRMVPLQYEHLAAILPNTIIGLLPDLSRSYFSDGSVSYCLLADNVPVFAGGVVNMQWKRGEAWMLPTVWFKAHVKTCYQFMKAVLPVMATTGGYKRIQATCATSVSPSLFRHLGFYSEGVLNCFGPNGESCHLYARLF